jgi:hypothetical protein
MPGGARTLTLSLVERGHGPPQDGMLRVCNCHGPGWQWTSVQLRGHAEWAAGMGG